MAQGVPPTFDDGRAPRAAGQNHSVLAGRAHTIFLSYAREDRKRAVQVIHALEKSGVSVWWDGLLESGARFSELTEQALERASAVVVLWSATSITSHWVQDEATRGRERGCLIPISIDGSTAPIGFRQFQVIDLRRWRGDTRAAEFERVVRGIAALVEGAAGGGVVAAVSGSARRKPRLIDRRVLLAAGGASAVAAGGIGAWWAGLFGGAAAQQGSVAVLPFDNISGDPSRDYFAAGLAAELRAELARNSALKVVAQASSEAFEGDDANAVDIARRLGVAHLLDGNVRWSGDRARINVELIDGGTGFPSWTKVFELAMSDIFSVQREIASAVTAALTSQLASPREEQQVGGTADVAAYDQFLHGRDLYERADSEAMDRAALARFDAAIAADPRFAAAHAARARSLTIIGSNYGSLGQTRQYYAAALTSAQRATTLAPTHAESLSTLGFVLSQAQLDVRAARVAFDRARALGGGDAGVLGRFAQFAALTGRNADAIAAIDRAAVLDPLNPLVHMARGRVLYAARQYAAALVPMRRALALNPQLGAAHALMGDVLLALGQAAAARAAYARESNALLRETGLAIAEHRLGHGAAAQAARARIIDGLGTGQVTYYQQAQIAAQFGEADTAMRALGAARAASDSGLLATLSDPLLDPLRQRADFTDLLSALHFV